MSAISKTLAAKIEMLFESLANKLILDIFQYLPAIRLVRAFHRLNSSLDDLLITNFRTHPFEFRAAAKGELKLVSRNDLPWLADHITYFHLSDNDENPQQVQLLLSHGWTLDRSSACESDRDTTFGPMLPTGPSVTD